jgi:type IV secretion system protein VirB5
MPAQHKSTVYKTTEIKNPFHDGQDKAYGDILLDKMNEMKWWRNIVGVGILGLSFLNLIFFIVALATQKTVPVLVNVMPNGEAVYLGEVKQNAANSQIPEAAITYQVRKFITYIRSVSTDAEVLNNNLYDCYYMVTGSYEPVMTKMLRENSPFDLVGKIRRTVDIRTVLRTTGNSFQVDWTENTIEVSGQARKRDMRAIVTVKMIEPQKDNIKFNPLGIFIDNCEWTEL